VYITGFEEIENRPDNRFDIVASNIPFGDTKVFDVSFSKSKDEAKQEATQKVHNYFFIKGVETLREGGVLAFIPCSVFPDNTPIMETDIYHCVNICSSKEYIYILYCGEQFVNRSSAKHSYILKFDSKGKDLNCYKTDYQLISICVDDKEQVYGSSISEALDPVFVEIDM
jgi:hypothetical protein